MSRIIPSMRCPKENGGCGEDGKHSVAIDRSSGRIAIDCQCGYRTSLPLDPTKMTVRWGLGPLDETGPEVKA